MSQYEKKGWNPNSSCGKGSQMWKMVKNPGKQPLYTPDSLWEKVQEYFQWVNDNPIYVEDIYGAKTPTAMDVKKERPFTLESMFTFLNITPQTWYNYKEKSSYLDIITIIENIIRSNKFEGAMVGIFNPNIVARDLGLVDKRVTENTNKTQVMLYIPDNKRKINVVAPPSPVRLQEPVKLIEPKQSEENWLDAIADDI